MIKKTIAIALCALAMDARAQQADTSLLHDEVVVTGTRDMALLQSVPATVSVIGRSDIESSSHASLLPVIMEHTPGLFATQRGVIGYGISTNSAGAIKVRGVGSGAQLLVLVDGQPQYSGLLGHPVPDAYQSMNAERVEVMRGPSSVLYGSNAMGGVVNIVTRKADCQGVESDLRLSGGSYGTCVAESSTRFGNGRVFGVANLSCQRTDGHRPNSCFHQMSGYAKAGALIGQRWKAVADISVTDLGFCNPGPEGAELVDSDARIKRYLASVSISNNGLRTGGTIRAFCDWGIHNINDGHLISAQPLDYIYKHRDYIAGINAFQNLRLSCRGTLTLGLDFQRMGGRAWNEKILSGSRSYYGPIDDVADLSLYSDYRQPFGDILTLDFGLRLSGRSRSGMELVPMAGASLHIAGNQDIKLMAGKGFRYPSISEMYMFAPNPDLEPERLFSYEISYRKRAKAGSAGFSVFLIDGCNVIQRVPREPGSGYVNVNAGEILNCGLEMDGRLRLGKCWAMEGNFSYLHAKTLVTGAPKYKMCLSASYARGRWSASALLEHIAGLRISLQDTQPAEYYTLLNASIGFEAASWMRLFVSGDNLLAQRYQTYQGFWMPKATFMAGAKFSLKSSALHYKE